MSDTAGKEAGRDRTFALGRNTMNRRVSRGTLLAATLALLATTALAQQPQDAPAQAPAPAAMPPPAPAPEPRRLRLRRPLLHLLQHLPPLRPPPRPLRHQLRPP